MRISDWSSDVCSSDLWGGGHVEDFRFPAVIDAEEQERFVFERRTDHLLRVSRYDQRPSAAQAQVLNARQQDPHASGWQERVGFVERSEERRVGKEWVSKCRSRWSRDQ